MNHIYIPTQSPADWRRLLAQPEKHWREGYSAMALAECWERADGFPAEFQALFATAVDPALREVELLLAIPEYKVSLPGGRRASQNDLFVLGRAQDGSLVTIMVEGKVAEPFGERLQDWKVDASEGKLTRLKYLWQVLGLPAEPPGHIRYQLLHRTASAVCEARRFNSRAALMVVHSFSPERAWFEDYQAFVGLFGARGEANQLVELRQMEGVQLYAGWVEGHASQLPLKHE